MNYEALLAKTLGDDEQEKLSAHFDSYTADELAELLKGSSELEPEMQEKTAFAPDPEPYNPRSIAPPPRRRSNRDFNPGPMGAPHGAMKLGSAELADAWGRELAHEDIQKVATFGVAPPKVPGLNGPVGSVGGAPKVGAGSLMSAKSPGIPKVGAARLRDAMDKIAAKPGMIASGINWLAPHLKSGVNTMRKATLGQAGGWGAAGGAVLGAGRHMMSGVDPQTGQKRTTLLGSMAGGAAIGGGMGLGLRAGAKEFHGSDLYKRMTSGKFKFDGEAAAKAVKKKPAVAQVAAGGAPKVAPAPAPAPDPYANVGSPRMLLPQRTPPAPAPAAPAVVDAVKPKRVRKAAVPGGGPPVAATPAPVSPMASPVRGLA